MLKTRAAAASTKTEKLSGALAPKEKVIAMAKIASNPFLCTFTQKVDARIVPKQIGDIRVATRVTVSPLFDLLFIQKHLREPDDLFRF